MFPEPAEQQKKLGLLGLAGASGNVLGLVLAGLCMLASYHWFFRRVCGPSRKPGLYADSFRRVIAIICILFSACTVFLLPYTGSSYSRSTDKTPRWKRMDIIGVLILEGALICFILSLTQGPIDGWSSASFIAPFVLSIPLTIAFFFWGKLEFPLMS